MSEIIDVAGVPNRTMHPLSREEASGNDKNPPSVSSIVGQLAQQGCWDGEDIGEDK